MALDIIFFDKTSQGQEVKQVSLINKNGMIVQILDYGATIRTIFAKDKHGNLRDVVLGFDNMPAYEKSRAHFGAAIGRHANRLAGSSFTLDGVTYNLPANEGKNQLHGGIIGFDRLIWSIEPIGPSTVRFTLVSPDGNEGYPGNLTTAITYGLTDDDELTIEYTAATDKPTIVNFTNHSYFNLNGHNSGTAMNHTLQLNSNFITEIGEGSIPTGTLLPVHGTPFDFTAPKAIGKDINDTSDAQIVQGGGYDHNYILDKTSAPIAVLAGDESGIVMETYTSQPGVQFYSGNFISRTPQPLGKDNAVYSSRDAVCLETQHYPDSPNHPQFPSVVLRPGEHFIETTTYKFFTH